MHRHRWNLEGYYFSGRTAKTYQHTLGTVIPDDSLPFYVHRDGRYMNQLGSHAGGGQDINFWFIVAAKIQQPISTQGTARRSIGSHLAGDRIRYYPSAWSTPLLIVAINRGETVVFEVGTALSNLVGEARQPAVAKPVEPRQRAFVHYA